MKARVAPTALIFAIAQVCAFAQGPSPCPRFAVGSAITQPQDLFSEHGILQVNFTYQTRVDQNGNALFCFVTDSGSESPTLHVSPGDRLLITLKNALPDGAPMAGMAGMSAMSGRGADPCTAAIMTASSVNIHFHGTNIAPLCHQDEVIRTMINSGETFQYDLQFPLDEPPGLYWYHPHIHGISDAAVLGGASGALIVEAIQKVNPEVAGLPQQVLILRDNIVPGHLTPGGNIPSLDVSLNYVPIQSPALTPAVIQIKPGEKQFWRVLNASADTIVDLQVQYDGTPQPLVVVGLDGVPTGSQDGTSRGKSITETHILLAPAARAEFITTGPSASVKNAALMSLRVDAGPGGGNNPPRTIAAIQASDDAPEPPVSLPYVSEPAHKQRFAELDREQATAERSLYFSVSTADPANPGSPAKFFITVDGQTPTAFSVDNPPAIVTTRGSVEDWTIENRSPENHEFHIHQIHFLLLEQNGVQVQNGQYLDIVQVPYWSGSGPYPSVKIRLDFRGPVIGDFVYHCHILGHEDNGMMATIRVNAPRAEHVRR
jgi:FtsP/CotA-like multicopper oxidase with cupredoxin domain